MKRGKKLLKGQSACNTHTHTLAFFPSPSCYGVTICQQIPGDDGEDYIFVYAGSCSFFPLRTGQKKGLKKRNASSQINSKLGFLTFGYIEVEEVAVQDSLNDASNYGDPILEALAIVTVDPV